MDTTSVRNRACEKAGNAMYFSVDAKYPRSSETLRQAAQAHLQRSGRAHHGSGYVTFRFMVDCAGNRQPRTQVLQTDAHYHSFHFSKELVEELYGFLKTLTDWRAATAGEGNSVNYLGYLTFKIKDGKVVAVIP